LKLIINMLFIPFKIPYYNINSFYSFLLAIGETIDGKFGMKTIM